MSTEDGWSLPAGPEGPGGDRNRDVYRALHENDCAQAQTALDNSWDADDEEQKPIQSRRDVLLFQAAIELCTGERERAREWLDRARALGLEGLASPVATSDEDVAFRWYCEVYRSLVSGLDRVPRETVGCAGGDPPGWPPGRRDDPRTEADESTVTTLDDGQPPAATSTAPTTAAPTTVPATVTTIPATTATPPPTDPVATG